MVAARHFYYWFIQTGTNHELPYEHSVDHGYGMLRDEVEPPETDALAL